MLDQRTAQAATKATPLRVHDGVLILHGYGLRISVFHGRLSVSDNLLGERRSAEFSRSTCGIRRLVLIGHTGLVTLDALRWLTDIGAAYVQIDADGKLIASFAPQGTNDVRLRRAQALAPSTRLGIAITRTLIAEKMRAQLELLRDHEHTNAARAAILTAAADLQETADPTRVRWLEGRAADVYWGCFAGLPLRFAAADRRVVPEHWLRFGKRASPVHGLSPHNAITPANALFNYAYQVLETEMRIAILAVGLDPEMAVFHSDRRFRNSLAHDLMEPLRPLVDRYVIELIGRRTFSARDFAETRQGVTRLAPSLARLVAETAPLWAERCLPIAMWLAKALAKMDSRSTILVAIPSLPQLGRLRADELPRSTCVTCGGPLHAGFTFCPSCKPLLVAENVRRMVAARRLAFARLRAAGRDTSHGAAAAAKRNATLVAQHARKAGWHRTREQMAADVVAFRTKILPALAGVALNEMVKATGLSKAHCSLIKRGLRVPHLRHWDLLSSLTLLDA